MSEFFDGNHLTLLNSGQDYFPALLKALDAARYEIFLESYIFADDAAGQAVIAALIRAAERGVAVHILVDGFGARNFPRVYGRRLRQSGVPYLLYRREVARFHLKRHRLRRLHRKLVVIDQHQAFVGGINIIDDDNAPPSLRPRYDYAVAVKGPVIAPIHKAMQRMWTNVAWASFKYRPSLPPTAKPQQADIAGLQRAAFLVRDNTLHRQSILNAYLKAIDRAEKEIIIANAYFLPGLRFRHALTAAAERGVRVSILLQGRTDHPLFYYATQALYKTLLTAGIRIFEYRKSFLHAKVAVIDQHWATVGSSNIDPFSLLLAKEGNLVIEDRKFARELRSSLKTAIQAGAIELTPTTLGQYPFYARLARWVSYGLVRLFFALLGYTPGQRQEDLLNPAPRPSGLHSPEDP